MTRRFVPLVIATIVASLALFPHVSSAWEADFTKPNAGFEPYHDEGGATLQMTKTEGRAVLSVQTPAKSTLEGACITIGPGIEGGVRWTFSAEVRGSGNLWVIASSRNGWLYNSNTVLLTDEWQTVSITKPLAVNDDRMRVCLLTKEVGVLQMQIRAASAEKQTPPTTYDRAVAPVAFEAEQTSVYEDRVTDLDGASGGRGCSHGSYILLSGIPTPRTSRPLFVYARVNMPDSDAYCAVRGQTETGSQRLNTMSPEVTGEWTWITGEPVAAASVGDIVRLQGHGAKEASGKIAIDRVAVSTQGDLSDEALDAARVVYLKNAPAFTAVRADSPPQLDGKADDACWEYAPVLSNFARQSTFAPAAHASQMQFAWDSQYLYWYFRGEEPVLRPEMNKLHEFKKEVTDRDDRVYKDDSVMLIIDPQDDSGLKYDFTLNAIGTVNDARIPGENLWESRETEFDADIVSESVIGDGFWTLEARIGFESLGIDPPQAGDTWRAIVGRIEQAEDETSSWNICGAGFHDPSAFAAMNLSETASYARMEMPGRLQLGENDLTASIRSDAEDTGYYAYSRVERKERFMIDLGFAPASTDTETATTTVSLDEEGDIELQYGIWDAVSLQPFLMTPAYPRSVKSSTAEVRIETDSPFKLYLNGSVIARGESSSSDEPLQVFLQKGVNAFGLELEDGTAQVDIGIDDGHITSSENWRLAPDDVDDFSAPKVDPRDWEHAPAQGGGPLGKRIGYEDASSRMRCTVLWEETRIFPNPTPALYVARGTNQHFTVNADGLPGHLLEDYILRLMIPNSFELVGVTGYYGVNNEEQPEFSVEQIDEDFPYEGERCAVYEISADQPIRYRESVRILELFNVFIKWDEEAGEPEDRDYPIWFGASADDGAIMEAWQCFSVRVVPPLNGKQPQELVWQLWGSFFGAMNKPELKEATMETMVQAGFNNIVAGDSTSSEIGDRLGIDNVQGINFEPWSINMEPYLEQQPDAALVNMEGETSDRYVCTTEILNGASGFITDRIHEIVADSQADVVDWDYESAPMSSYIACFCPECLAKFREYAEIPADTELDGQIIRENYREEWIDWMTLRMAQVAKLFQNAAHTADPPAKFSAYSAYQSPDTRWRYGVNWQYIGDLEAVDIAACGYGRDWEAIVATHEALGGIPLVCGKIMKPYDRNSNDVPVPATKAILLRRLIDSTGGILVYDRMPIEGRTWQASAEVTRFAAEYEEVIRHGEFPEIDGIPWGAGWVGVRSHEKTMLIAVMNTTSQEKSYTLPLPDAQEGIEFYSQQEVTPGEEISVTLEPGDARVYVLTLQ